MQNQVNNGGKFEPLVQPTDALSDSQLQRYSRHLVIPGFGEEAQRRLANARVLVIGAGGLGSPVLMYLAAAGAGTIGIVDDDTVDVSNLQRQIIHGQGDIGTLKSSSAARSIAEINPDVTVIEHRELLDNSNAVELFSGYDIILDGTDNFATRYLVADAATLADKPYVWGSILRFEGQVSLFWDSHGPSYRDLFPEPPLPGTVPSCADGGVLGVLCGIVGSVMATEAIKAITCVGKTALGTLMVIDALNLKWRTLQIEKDPERAPVTQLGNYEAFCGIDTTTTLPEVSVEELAELRHRGEPAIIDVREQSEWDIVHLDDATLIPRGQIMSGERDPGALVPAGVDEVYVYCKGGTRSSEVVRYLRNRGVNAINVRGGVIDWVEKIEPHKRRY